MSAALLPECGAGSTHCTEADRRPAAAQRGDVEETQGSRASAAAPRLEALDAPRWIASIQIVLSHFYIDGHIGRDGFIALPARDGWWHEFARYGKNWTQFFFVLSGFVLAYAEMVRPPHKATKVTQLQYVRRRLLGIYPTFLFSTLCYLLQVRLLRQPTAFQWASLAPTVLLLQSWVVVCGEDPGIDNTSFGWNVPSWFMSALVLYWLLLRPAANFFKNRGLLTTGVCWCGLWAFSLVPGMAEKVISSNSCLYFNLQNGSLGYFHVFLAGVATARVFVLTCLKDADTGGPPTAATARLVLAPERAPRVFRCGCCLGYGLYALYFVFVDMEVMFLTFHNGGILPILALITLGAAIGVDPLARYVFQSRFFLALGKLSYAQYLMQMPVFVFLASFFGGEMFDYKTKLPPKLPLWAQIIYPFALLAVAYVVQRFIQRPYTEWQVWRKERGIKGFDERVIDAVDGWLDRHWQRRQARHVEATDCVAPRSTPPAQVAP